MQRAKLLPLAVRSVAGLFASLATTVDTDAAVFNVPPDPLPAVSSLAAGDVINLRPGAVLPSPSDWLLTVDATLNVFGVTLTDNSGGGSLYNTAGTVNYYARDAGANQYGVG